MASRCPNLVVLERAHELLERSDLRAQLVAFFGIADRARPIVDLDFFHRRDDIAAAVNDGVGAVEVMVLREIHAVGIEHEREALVAVRRRERAVDRDRAALALDRRLALLELDRHVAVDDVAARRLDAELRAGLRRRTPRRGSARNTGSCVSSCVGLVGDEVGLERRHPVLAEAAARAARSTDSTARSTSAGSRLRKARLHRRARARRTAPGPHAARRRRSAAGSCRRRRPACSRGRSRAIAAQIHLAVAHHELNLAPQRAAIRRTRAPARRCRSARPPIARTASRGVERRQECVEERIRPAVDFTVPVVRSMRCSSRAVLELPLGMAPEQLALELELEDRHRLLHARDAAAVAQAAFRHELASRDRRRRPCASCSSGSSEMP